jgi:hypothetical protein
LAQNDQQFFPSEGTEIAVVMGHLRDDQLIGKPNFPRFLVFNDFMRNCCKQSNEQLFAQLVHDLMESNKCSIHLIAQGLENLKEKIKVLTEGWIESTPVDSN